ncbi:MAG: hypothetical protein QOK28_1972 [Actinomycetota bacterium]|jgi:hypothetical protein
MSPVEPRSIPRSVESLLSEGRQAYVAFESGEGPHVTPELYTWSDGRLWVAAATSTLKARVVENGTRVAAAVIGRGTAVILEGAVEVFDPRKPLAAVRGSSGSQMARALVSFTTRNTGDLLGFARDTIKGNSVSRLPKPRVLLAIEPDQVAFVENDRVTWQSGWASTVSSDDARDVPTGGVFAVAAFDGPRVAPARWFADDERAHVTSELLALQGISGDTGVAVVVDDYNAPGPGAKQGTLVRGDATVEDDGWIRVRPRRTVDWDGTETTRR